MLKLGRFEALGTVPQKTWSSFMFLYVIIACPCACPSHRSLILSCPGVAKLGKRHLNYLFFKKWIHSKSIPFQDQVCWILELLFFSGCKLSGALCANRPFCLPTLTLSPHHTSSYLLMSKLWWYKDWHNSFNFQVLVLKSTSFMNLFQSWKIIILDSFNFMFLSWNPGASTL